MSSLQTRFLKFRRTSARKGCAMGADEHNLQMLATRSRTSPDRRARRLNACGNSHRRASDSRCGSARHGSRFGPSLKPEWHAQRGSWPGPRPDGGCFCLARPVRPELLRNLVARQCPAATWTPRATARHRPTSPPGAWRWFLPTGLLRLAVSGAGCGRVVSASRPCDEKSSSIACAARVPKTRPSSSEFEANRFAPWTPVQAASPAAKSPGNTCCGHGGRS